MGFSADFFRQPIACFSLFLGQRCFYPQQSFPIVFCAHPWLVFIVVASPFTSSSRAPFNPTWKVMGGARLLAIEAKCYDLLLDDEGKFFQLQIIKRGKGFIKSLILDRNASFWLLSTLRYKTLPFASSFIRRFEGDGKVFVGFGVATIEGGSL